MMRYIVDFFRRNLMKKFLSLVTAVLLWFFVMEAQDPTIEGSYEITVTPSNVPYEFFVNCAEKTIKIKTRAPRSYFVKYDSNAFRAYANLDGLKEGNHELTPQIVMPQGFELVETNPPIVHVIIDSFTERQMPFELVTKGNVSSDTAIKNMTKSMDVVTVMGPKSLVEQVTKVFGTLTFSSNTESFEAQIPMKAVDKENNQVPLVRVVPSVVTVDVDLESGAEKKIVPIVAELTTADGWEVTKVSVDPAQIEITGAESVVNSIVTIKTVPFTVQTGQRVFKEKLKLEVPEGVTVKTDEVNVSAEVVRKTVMSDVPRVTTTNPNQSQDSN